MENIQEVNQDNILNIVLDYIYNFIIENNYDPNNIRPINFNFILMNTYLSIIKPNKNILLKIDNNTNNTYDYNKVYNIYNIYKYICNKYNHDTNISGFCEFSGISRETIYGWNESSGAGIDIYQKIMQDNESSLESMLKDTRYNPMKILPILNRRHNWNLPGVTKETKKEALISRDNIQIAGSAETAPALPEL